MKKDTTRRAMDQVDDRLISRCNEVRTAAGAPVKTVRHPVFDFMKGVACFLLCGALVVGLMMLPKKKKDTVGYEGSDGDDVLRSGEAEPVKDVPDMSSDGAPAWESFCNGLSLWGSGVERFIVANNRWIPGEETYIRSADEFKEYLKRWSDYLTAIDSLTTREDMMLRSLQDRYDGEYFDYGGSLVFVPLRATQPGYCLFQPYSAAISPDGVLEVNVLEYTPEYGTVDDDGNRVGYTAVLAISQPITDIQVVINESESKCSVLLDFLISYGCRWESDENPVSGPPSRLYPINISDETAGYTVNISDPAVIEDFYDLLQTFTLTPAAGAVGESEGSSYILKFPGDCVMFCTGGTEIGMIGVWGDTGYYSLTERDAGLLDAAIAALLRYGTGSGGDTDDPPSSTDAVTTAPDETVWDTKAPDDTSGDTTDPVETDVPTSVFGSIRFDLLHDGICFDEDPCSVHIFRDYDVLKQFIIDKVGEEAFYTRYASTGWYDKYFASCEQTLKKGGTVVIIPLETPSGGDRLEPAGAVLKDGVLTVTLNHYRIGMTDDIGVWTAILSAGGEITDCQVQFNRPTGAPDEGAGGKVGVMQGKCIYDIQYPEGSDERNIEWSVTLSPDATVPDVTVRTEGDRICLNDDFRIGGPGNGCMSFYVGAPAGSGKTFLCFCMSLGSGICDERIVIIDPKTGETVFTLCDRMIHDYTLFLRDGTLCVAETEYPAIPGKEPIRTGTFCFTGTDIRVIWDDIVTLGD